MSFDQQELTQMLLEWGRNSNQEALNKLMPLIYDELRRLASRYMNKERADHTLQTTALVHEAYVRLIDQRRWNGKIERISLGLRRSSCGGF
jgi:RNA polymerase sigma-70 factor, ECF subfamily